MSACPPDLLEPLLSLLRGRDPRPHTQPTACKVGREAGAEKEVHWFQVQSGPANWSPLWPTDRSYKWRFSGTQPRFRNCLWLRLHCSAGCVTAKPTVVTALAQRTRSNMEMPSCQHSLSVPLTPGPFRAAARHTPA